MPRVQRGNIQVCKDLSTLWGQKARTRQSTVWTEPVFKLLLQTRCAFADHWACSVMHTDTVKQFQVAHFTLLLFSTLLENAHASHDEITYPENHPHVAWNELQPDKIYHVMSSIEIRHFPRNELPAGVPGYYRYRTVSVSGIIKVYEVDRRDEDETWYRVKWIKPRTIGDQDDIHGWINARDLEDYGAYEMP